MIQHDVRPYMFDCPVAETYLVDRGEGSPAQYLHPTRPDATTCLALPSIARAELTSGQLSFFEVHFEVGLLLNCVRMTLLQALTPLMKILTHPHRAML